MNTDLHHFVTRFLSVVFATLMSVSFVAFVSIPYSLGGHPGEDNQHQTTQQLLVTAEQQPDRG